MAVDYWSGGRLCISAVPEALFPGPQNRSQPHIEELHPEQHHAHYTQHGAPLVQEPESESEGEPGWSCRSLMMEGC